jgi:capsular exopolysaccharide synthesis family protein
VELWDYLLLARRQWWIILVSVLLAVGAATLLTLTATPRYSATIKMFVSSSAQDPAVAFQGGAFTQQRAKSYADLLRSERIANAVIQKLALRTTVKKLRSEVHAEAAPDTVMIKATVTDPTPVQAQRIANALGQQLSVLVAELERTSSKSPVPVKVTMVDSAALPRTPVSPRPLRDLLVALAAGLLLGFGFTVVRERLDRSVRSAEKLNALTQAPVLGVIGHDPKAGKRPLVVHIESHAARSEAFRQLRTSLQYVDVEASAKRIVVTSCNPGEGKTSTTSNLAITLAQAGQRVVVVDADLRQPLLSKYLGIEGAAGLTDVLVGRAELDDVLQSWGDLPMHVLPSGPIPPNPSELLGSRQMEELIDELQTRADLVLFDTPPLLPVTDPVVLTRHCDGALLVVKHGSTQHAQVKRAVTMLGHTNARLLGVLLNMVPKKGAGADDYGYGYGTYAPHSGTPESVQQEPVPPVTVGAAGNGQ